MTASANTPPVQTGDVAQQVDALRAMRRESAIWRYASLGIIALMVIYSIATLRSSAMGLAQPGPTQTEFTTLLTTGLQKDVIPNVQQIATQTLTEMRPEVIASFQKLNNRTPELAEASVGQLNLLQTNLQTRSEKVLDETFSAEFKKREGKIKEMFPDVTEDKIKTLVDNMTALGEKHIPSVVEQMTSKHLKAVDSISVDIQTIKAQEKISPNEDVATWEMALSILDLVRDDLRELAPAAAKTDGKTSDAKPADAKPAAKGAAK